MNGISALKKKKKKALGTLASPTVRKFMEMFW